MQLDEKLIFDIQYLSNGASLYTIANLTGAYRTSVEIYNEGGSDEFCELALETERCMRVLLTKLRLEEVTEIDWDRCVAES